MTGHDPATTHLHAPLSVYTDMPEPECIMTLSWKDIVERAEQFGISLTRGQVLEIFETLVRRCRTEVISEDFWTAIDIEIEGVES